MMGALSQLPRTYNGIAAFLPPMPAVNLRPQRTTIGSATKRNRTDGHTGRAHITPPAKRPKPGALWTQ